MQLRDRISTMGLTESQKRVFIERVSTRIVDRMFADDRRWTDDELEAMIAEVAREELRLNN